MTVPKQPVIMRLATRSGMAPMLSPNPDITTKNTAKLTTTAMRVAKSHVKKKPQPTELRFVAMVCSYLVFNRCVVIQGAVDRFALCPFGAQVSGGAATSFIM
jgi:hypothetical protein